MAHTKGEWEYDQALNCVYDDGGKEICSLPSFKVSAANARLITLAPQLLTTLKELLISIKFGKQTNLGKDQPNICWEARIPRAFVLEAEKAIKQAEEV